MAALDGLTRMISVLGVMFFPRDEAKRRSYEDAVLGKAADSLLDQRRWPTVERLQLFELARAGPAFDGLSAEALKVIRRNKMNAASPARPVLAGSLAANALIIPLICNLKYDRTDVGLHQAFRVMLGTNQKDDPRGLRNLQNVWAHYEPVSHFWAAWEMFDYFWSDALDDVTAFVSLGTLIGAWGEQYRPLRASSALLSSDSVSVPDDWLAPATFPLADWDLTPEAKARLFN